MEMKAKATDNVTSVKLNVIKLFTCTQVLVLEIRNKVIEIGIRVLKQIHLNMSSYYRLSIYRPSTQRQFYSYSTGTLRLTLLVIITIISTN